MGQSISLYDYECKIADGRQLGSVRKLVDDLLVDRSENLHPSVIEMNIRVVDKEVKFYIKECTTVVLYKSGKLVGCAMLDQRVGRNVIEHIVLNDRNSVGSGLMMFYVMCKVWPEGDVYVNVADANSYSSAVEKYSGGYRIRDGVREKLIKSIGSRIE